MNANRKEKFLCRIAMVAKFLDEKKLKTSLKVNLQFFKLHLSYSISFNLSHHVDEISEVESERTISNKLRKKEKIFALCLPTL